MRFLFLCTKYPLTDRDTYMTSELADALVRAGHAVDVVVLDWDAKPGAETERKRQGGISVLRIAPRAWTRFGTLVYRTSKFLLSDRHAVAEVRRHIPVRGYDVCVAWSPALTVAGLLRAAKREHVPNRVLFIWDFFPIHHREIGMIPAGPIYEVAKVAEERAMACVTAIICNLPGNIDYLKRLYRIGRQRLSSTPVWSETTVPLFESRASIRVRYDLPADRPIAIFGGQITDGRGVELMLDAARNANQAGSDILFLFVGNGRLVEAVRNRAAMAPNVRHFFGVARNEYLSLVAACDIGMVATVPGVSSFSFPSKTIDYLRAGVPVVAAVEPGSDYLHIITEYQIGRAVDFDDALGFARAIQAIVDDPDLRTSIRERSVRCLDEVFDVRHAVQALLDALCETGTTGTADFGGS